MSIDDSSEDTFEEIIDNQNNQVQNRHQQQVQYVNQRYHDIRQPALNQNRNRRARRTQANVRLIGPQRANN